MTREELRDYVEEQRSLNNIPYHVYSALIDGIDTLEQEPVIDKVRAEIEQLPTSKCSEIYRMSINADDFKENVLAIFDKYKGESEET